MPLPSHTNLLAANNLNCEADDPPPSTMWLWVISPKYTLSKWLLQASEVTVQTAQLCQNIFTCKQKDWNMNEAKSLVKFFEQSTCDLVRISSPTGCLKYLCTAEFRAHKQIQPCSVRAQPNDPKSFEKYTGLRMGIQASANIFRAGNKFHNDYSWAPYSEMHLKHHFQLSHSNNTFQGQIGFYLDTCWYKRGIILRRRYLIMRTPQIWRKINHRVSCRIFLIYVRDDLVEMAKFLHHWLGLNKMSSENFGINKVEFEWKGPKFKNIATKSEKKKKLKQLDWKNLKANMNECKEWNARQFDTDKRWKQNFNKEAKCLGKIYRDIKLLLTL
ncbi:hypothetical protein VP01_541g8 [Puccinia sorghi]|uniref:Uncharacterized protein n=1 Tax=Puccinia sorghi TaxID=27349 RepID=A0A0L6UJT3_9BASI|nr:hypothetical protein VP01_541g8 [Puccinia sorghi]